MKKICILLVVLTILCLPFASYAMDENAYITRAEFAKELLVAASIDVDEVFESSFEDVTDPQYVSYIEAAYKNGIVSGYGEKFKPEENVTKEQAVVMIVKVFGERAALRDISGEDIEQTLNFLDIESISEWAKPYITYALNIGLIEEDANTFYPGMLLTEDKAGSLISGAKAVYEELFTREGLSASDMLVLANEKISEYNTYKQKGTMEMIMKMNMEGLPQEEIQNNQEIAALLGEGMNMHIDMEMQTQTPDKIYIKEIIRAAAVEDMDQEVEVFMDGSVMYTKMTGADKWIMQDMSSIMNTMQSISGNDPYKVSQLSDDELNLFKEYARFEDDAELSNNEYYVIDLNIDKDTYKEYYMEIIEKTMDSVIELQTEAAQFQEAPDFNPDQYKQMMIQLVNQMEIEIEYKFYINKETKNYEKMWISQDVYMSMDQLIEMVKSTVGEDVPDLSVNMLTHTEGEFNLYDFNKRVNFPEIGPEDIMDYNQPGEAEDHSL